MDGLQKAMTIKYGVNWKSERFPRGAKTAEKELLDHLGMENFIANRDNETSKELLLTTLFKQTFHLSLTGGAKEAASIGHKLENPFAANCSNTFPT